MFGGIQMERVTEPKKSIITNLMDNYHLVRSHPAFDVYPQMPIHQIEIYVKQAARKERNVTIQLNPSPFTKGASEVTGKVSLSPRSSHIILADSFTPTIHLIQPYLIRHVRLTHTN